MAIVYAAPRHIPIHVPSNLIFVLRVETFRLCYLFFFCTMIIFAKTVTKYLVLPLLLAGAPAGTPIERLGCGAFNRNGEVDNRFGLSYGEGFDFYTENHLADAFGYGNICTDWDYSPSREITALYFPFFEYSLVIYIVLEWVTVKISHKRGELPDWYMRCATTLYPLCIFLCICFRMIFIALATESVNLHTAGFLCLQIALLTVAVMNVWYVLLTGQSYPNWSKARIARFAKIYLYLNVLISSLKIYGTIQIVKTGKGPAFYYITPIPDLFLGQILDLFYMLLNVLIPIFIAFKRRQSEDPLKFEISIPNHCYEGEDAQSTESTSLVNN